ncbi:MAG: fused MFS/spermidine synthase [Deltaproteobacteria bacterium]|nr:fused MFS/spermidine synthase [Deltaproteobacteria bacterium]
MTRPIVLLCFFFSGFSGLLYEVLWLRMLILIFGSTTLAISTVLTAFMGGLALGSFIFGRLMDRQRRPLLYYGILEGVIGLYALAIPFIFTALIPLYKILWQQFHLSFYAFTLVQFLLVSLVLIVPTTCMGATLPILSTWAVREESSLGVTIGRLYALNTFGAVCGTALSGFVLLPALGVRQTLWIAVVVNLLVALLILSFLPRFGSRPETSAPGPRPPVREGATAPGTLSPRVVWFIVLGIALSGFISMIYEVAWSRTLSLLVDSSVYGFTIMLTTFLVGIAVGSYFFSRRVDRLRSPGFVWALMQIGVGLLAFGSLLFFQELPYAYLLLYRSIGQNINLLLTGKFLLAFFIMLAPTLLMGALFPLTIKIYTANLKQIGRFVGNIYTVNTIGCILGSFAGGFFLIPWLGIRNTILLGIGLNLLYGLFILLVSPAPRLLMKRTALALTAVLTALIFIFPPQWQAPLMASGVYIYAHNFENTSRSDLLDMYSAENDHLLYYKEGPTCTISVHKSKYTGTIYMKSNGKVEASTKGDMPTQVLVAQIPLLLAPKVDELLVVGMGSGVTVGSMTTFPAKKITLVELEQAVIEGSHFFDHVNYRPLADPRLVLRVADARNYLLVTPDTYDVIISEPSNPWMAGIANVFTVEFFKLGYEKLKPEGVFCQWLQLYKISPESFKTVLRTFHAVFPHVYVFQPQEKDLVLVGFKKPPVFSLDEIEKRMHWERVAADLQRINVPDLKTFLGKFLMGPKEIKTLIQTGPLNTDDTNLIEFSTPKSLFEETAELNSEILEPFRRPAQEYFDRQTHLGKPSFSLRPEWLPAPQTR